TSCNGDVFKDNTFTEWAAVKGIQLHFSPLGNHYTTGRIERLVEDVAVKTRASIATAVNLPNAFRLYGSTAACFVREALVIRAMFVFTLKCNSEGEMTRFKARLAAHRNKQIVVRDLNATFAAAVAHGSARTLFASAAAKSLPVHSLDGTSSYVHARLKCV
ncbi:hypothetical protein H9P43_001291, partial [Blastocladiella emersonii ATCC 22665]